MNGYKLLAESYKKIIEKEEKKGNDAEELKKEVKVFEFLAECDTKEKNALFNSGAFNDICKAYFAYCMKQAEIEEAEIHRVLAIFIDTLDFIQAAEILKREGYNEE